MNSHKPSHTDINLSFRHIAYVFMLGILMHSTTGNTQMTKGADIGWLSYFESTLGITYLNESGEPQDAMEIMQDHDMNAIRLRAFVDPTNETIGEVDTEGVVKNAVRANNLGMDVMITIHYSDSWADPGQQYKPASWQGLSFDELEQAVYDYTYGLMDALLTAGVTPKWVQVGNETNPGFIWEDGRLDYDDGFANMSNYVALSNQGYDAIKDRSPTTQVMTHLADGNNTSFCREFFDAFYASGGKNDIIGVSYYPRWHGGTVQEVGETLNELTEQYDKDVMICEIGNWETEQSATYNLFVDAIEVIEAVPGDRGLGVICWEPIAHSSINGYDQGLALPTTDSTYQLSWVLDGFKDGAQNCTPTSIIPFVRVEGGTLEQASSATAASGSTVTFSPQAGSDTDWSWTGPNGFTATTRELVLADVTNEDAGFYIASYSPADMCQADQVFFLEVFPAGDVVVLNPGFETGEVAPWIGVGNYGVDTDLKNSGIYSGWFGGGVSELSQKIEGLKPDSTYEFSCYIRNWTGDGGVVTIGVRDFGGTEVTAEVSRTGDNGNAFELANVNFTMGSTDSSAVIYAATTRAQTWGKLDDARVRSLGGTVSSEEYELQITGELFTIYPNPATERLHVRAERAMGNVHIVVYTPQGGQVLRQSFNTSQGNSVLSISHLPKGVYIVTLENDAGGLDAQKLVIE